MSVRHPAPGTRYLTTREAAVVLGVSKMTLWRYVQEGLIPAEQTAEGGWYRIRRADLEKYIARIRKLAERRSRRR